MNLLEYKNRVAEQIENTIEYDDNFSKCFKIKDVELPPNWGKQNSDVLIMIENDVITLFFDSDINPSDPEISSKLSIYSNKGWIQFNLDENVLKDPNSLVNYFRDKHNLFLRNNGNDSDTTLGMIANFYSYHNENNINFVFQYSGSDHIAAFSILDKELKEVKVLNVMEIKEGWNSLQWDFKNENGKVVVNGLYYLLIRISQDSGELRKIEIIYK